MSSTINGLISWLRQWFDDIYALKSEVNGNSSSEHSHGYISSNGTMSTTGTVVTADNDYILYADRDNTTAKKIRATTKVNNNLIVDSSAYSNIGSSANATQKTINSKINTKLGQVSTLDQVYPIGSIYMSVNNTNPSTLFGGTWEQLKDRFLLGAGDSYSNGNTGGEATHTLSQNEMPVHAHKPHQWSIIVSNNANSGNYNNPSGKFFKIFKDDANQNRWTTDSGGGQAHNNMPPYLVVYMWKRTA